MLLTLVSLGSAPSIISPAAELIVLGFASALCGAVFFAALRECRISATYYPIFCLIGLFLSAFYEPVGDLLGQVRYHNTEWRLMHAFGTDIPLWVLPTYAALFGIPCVYFNHMLGSNRSLKYWICMVFIAGLGSFLLEAILIKLGMVRYYGRQPFSILGYPLWIGVANGSLALILGGWLAILRHRLRGDTISAAVILLTPVIFAGAHCVISLPTALALNAKAEPLALNLISLLSCAIALLMVAITRAFSTVLVTKRSVPVDG